jgi:cation diffusion facilitator family transporter
VSDTFSISAEENTALTRRVTALSVATAGTLTVLKAIVWVASGSVAILSSFADSSLDLIAALGAFWAVRYAAAPPDAEHQFGHGKAEAFASLVQAGLVFASAALIGQEAIRHLVEPHRLERTGWGIAVMAFSTVLTGGLITVQTRVLRRARSLAVAGDRTHYMADLAANLIALVSIALAALFGISGFDAAGGMAVAALLLWGAIGVFRQASSELMDRELPEEARRRIIDLMTEDPRLTDVHQLRTRASGPFVHIQMHADLDPGLSLETAHEVVVAAEKRVLSSFPAADIIIHADPRGRAEPHGGAFAETYDPRVQHEGVK